VKWYQEGSSSSPFHGNISLPLHRRGEKNSCKYRGEDMNPKVPE